MVNHAAINMGVQVSLLCADLHFFGVVGQGHKVVLFLVLRNFHNAFHRVRFLNYFAHLSSKW
jgi:hypothetical protein